MANSKSLYWDCPCSSAEVITHLQQIQLKVREVLSVLLKNEYFHSLKRPGAQFHCSVYIKRSPDIKVIFL